MAYQETNEPKIWSTQLTANDATAKETPGVIRTLGDGRQARYVKMTGGALASGKLVKPAAIVAVTNATSANGAGPDGATTTIITDSDATWTSDTYIGCYFKVSDVMTGSEEAIKIVGNTATTLTLEKQITTALASGGTDDGEIIPANGYVIITAIDDLTQACSGVGIGTITQNYYGWVGTRGYFNVLSTASLTEGQQVSPGGATTTGQAADTAGATENSIGITVANGGTNDFQLVDLKIT